MELRDYQKEALKFIWADLFKEKKSLCVLPTGTGKTELFIKLVEDYLEAFPGKRALIMLNKIKLLKQTEKRFAPIFGKDRIGIFCGSVGVHETAKPITIASIQSIHDIKVEDLGLIVLDEVHNVDQESGRYRDF